MPLTLEDLKNPVRAPIWRTVERVVGGAGHIVGAIWDELTNEMGRRKRRNEPSAAEELRSLDADTYGVIKSDEQAIALLEQSDPTSLSGYSIVPGVSGDAVDTRENVERRLPAS
jgi:hypothetical protein